jgi:hypothetical protein
MVAREEKLRNKGLAGDLQGEQHLVCERIRRGTCSARVRNAVDIATGQVLRRHARDWKKRTALIRPWLLAQDAAQKMAVLPQAQATMQAGRARELAWQKRGRRADLADAGFGRRSVAQPCQGVRGSLESILNQTDPGSR